MLVVGTDIVQTSFKEPELPEVPSIPGVPELPEVPSVEWFGQLHG